MTRHTFRVGGRLAAAAPAPETPSALLASGVPLASTFEMTQGGPASRFFTEQMLAAGFAEVDAASWPCDVPAMKDGGSVAFRDGEEEVVYRASDGTLTHVSLGHGWFFVRVAAAERGRVDEVFAALRELYPASFLTAVDDGLTVVPITFWTLGPMGPQSRLRRIESAHWDDIERNYTAPVRDELARIMEWSNGPDVDGKLLLWYGPPGTGKTWALRVLATRWAPWAEFHFITDSDVFFVRDAAYMIEVLLAGSYSAIDEPTGDLYTEANADDKWRVLIFEDTGQLLAADASDTYRQGLGRFLNVVDGMIGQGLRILAVVTTNDELTDLHPAVTRPGRCASQIEFGPLTAAEAQAWTGDPDAGPGTLAELYARGAQEARDALADGGTAETPAGTVTAASGPQDASERSLVPQAVLDAAAALAAAVEAAKEPSVVDAIRQVAEDVNPLAVDYGSTAYDTETKTVLWVAGDGTSEDEVDQVAERFLAIDGVENFEHEHEAMPTGWCGADVVYVYKASRDSYDCGDGEAAIEREFQAVVELAATPLPAE